MSCGVTWPTAHPRFLIGDGEGPCVCTVFLLNNCIGKGWHPTITASESIHVGWHRLNQEQIPQHICIHAIQHVHVCIGYGISQNHRWFSSWDSSLNSNPGGEAGCSKEQYEDKLLSCGHCKREVLLENYVSVKGEGVSGEKQGHSTPTATFLIRFPKQEMNMDLSCVTYSYVSVLGPKRSWYLRGRAEAVLATSPRCSKA